MAELNLQDRGLTELPPVDPDIVTMFIQDNRLTTLPPLPPNLKTLDCHNNELTSLPELPETLEVLACSGNQLTTIPRLPDTLRDLNMGRNPLKEPYATWYREFDTIYPYDLNALRQKVNSGIAEREKGKDIANLRKSQLESRIPEDVVRHIGSILSDKKGTLKQQGLQLHEKATRPGTTGVGGKRRRTLRRKKTTTRKRRH